MPRAAVGGTVIPVGTVGTLVSTPSTPTSSYLTNQVSFMSSPSSEDQISSQGKKLFGTYIKQRHTILMEMKINLALNGQREDIF